MTGASSTIGFPANQGGDETGIIYPKTGITQRLIVECLKSLAPVKTWGYLVNKLNISDRLAKHRMARTREFSIDELAALLRTDDGYKILAAVMADAKPAWWRICVPLMETAEIERMQIMARRRLEKQIRGTLDAHEDLTETIDRARSVAVYAPERLGRKAHGYGPIARGTDRPLAAQVRRGR